MRVSTRSSKLVLFHTSTLLLLITYGETKPNSQAERFRPLRPSMDVQKEGRSFWHDYGERDLRSTSARLSSFNRRVARNVIVFVGDGMGIQTLTMARIYKGQKEGRSGEETEMVWDKFDYTGLSKTYNTDRQVPDSAGTATALFTGVKTRMGVLGIDHEPVYNSCDTQQLSMSSLPTLVDHAQSVGKSTGVVTTARVTHATPAALYAKTANRNWESDTDVPEDKRACKDIASQLIHSEVANKMDVVMGGGRRNFLLQSQGGRRADEDLVAKYKKEMRERHPSKTAQVLYNREDLLNWRQKPSDFVLGLFAQSHMSYEVDRDQSLKGEPSLAEMTAAAINRLADNENGFFLMVESARIDHAHHDTNARRALDENDHLELAVRETLSNPNLNLDETLIIVTADHSHSVTFNGYPSRGNSIFGYVYNEPRVEFIAYPDQPEQRFPYSTISYANGNGYFNHYRGVEAQASNPKARNPWVDLRSIDFMDVDYLQPAMMPGPEGYETHGGEDVAIFAQGPAAHLLTGVHEESYIGHVMQYAMCGGMYREKCDIEQRSKADTLNNNMNFFIVFNIVFSLFNVGLFNLV